MKRIFVALALMMVAGGAFWVGTKCRSASAGKSDGPRILYYVDPMNPSHTSPEPGLAPCGMKMEPVYADASGTPAAPPPGTVSLSVEKQQLIGVRLGTVEKKPLSQTLRVPGRVVADETRIFRINATVDGWITSTRPVTPGTLVKKNETLATFYSAEFLSAGQALLFALKSLDRAESLAPDTSGQSNRVNQFKVNLQQYKDSLRNLGMSEVQIEEMIQSRKFQQNINIVAPADGFISLRNVSDGQRFEKGTELFRLVDLSQVWIQADVFAREAAWIRPDGEVRIFLPHQEKAYTAKTSTALPQFDGISRTLKVRLEAENTNFVFKPDMLVDVEFSVNLPEGLIVPADAVLDSGLRQTVFVALTNNCFEPRPVQLGLRLGDQVQIRDGLQTGERIVVSGNFLLDSESRMKLAAVGLHGTPAIDPVCDMKVDIAEAKADNCFTEYQKTTYYFCGDGCKEEFKKDPSKYLKAAKPD